MANEKIRGKDLRISFEDTTQKQVALAQECTYAKTRTFLEANHKDNANHIEREPDVMDYNITGTSLLTWAPDTTNVNFEFIYDALTNGTAVTWEFTTGVDKILTGSGYFETGELTANDGEYSIEGWTLVANGPDSLDDVP